MSFQKPENAITRANEFIHVGDKIGALNTLRAVITSRKFRVWSSTMERLMLMYVDLSVELRKGKEAKDGLHQYRNICQQVNVGSLGKVIERFLEQAEASAKDAQSEADAITLAAIEDLEAEDAPESILLERVSGEDNKDRTDREIVTPWLKFLWETYRTVLDILRNNSKLEYLYQTTAQRAFEFCEKYKRNTEFRRLSEILRNHLNILPKYSHQTNAISLSSPESMQFHLETRFSQLNVACNLELWQDAFRSVEDLHGLMNMAKKPLKPQLMANYYEKLTQIFWVSGNHLFHAHAWNKFYNLSRNQNKNLTEEELKLMSSTVLLASLCIPLKAQNGEFFDLDDVEKQKTSRLAVLLGSVSNFLSRESILEELIARNGPVLPELHDLYALLEVKFHPLEFVQSLKPKLDFVSGHPSLSKYAEPLQKIVFIRCLQQLSRVYKTMKIEALAKMIDFVDPTQLEKMMVEAVKNNFVSLRIDHQNSQINFGKEDLGSDKLRNQLTLLARNLKTVVGHISPESPEAKQAKKEALFGKILQTLERDHKRILERKKITERRKEIREALSILEEKEHYEQQEKAAKKKRKEQPKIKKAKPKEENLPFGIKKPEEPSEDALAKLAAAKKAKREGERRQANIAKKKDFLIRALREEERELLVAHYEEQQAQDKEWYEEQRDEYIKKQELAHERKLAEKRRLERMHEVRATFEKELEERREQKYQKLKAEQDERLKETREKVAEDRKKREIEREKRRQELEEQKKKQEEARRLAEEERKKKQEQREKEEREAEARAAELLKERESQPEWPQDPGRQDEESDRWSDFRDEPPPRSRLDREPPRGDWGPRDMDDREGDRWSGRGGDDRWSGRGGDDRWSGRGGDDRWSGRGGDDRWSGGGGGGDDRWSRGPPGGGRSAAPRRGDDDGWSRGPPGGGSRGGEDRWSRGPPGGGSRGGDDRWSSGPRRDDSRGDDRWSGGGGDDRWSRGDGRRDDGPPRGGGGEDRWSRGRNEPRGADRWARGDGGRSGGGDRWSRGDAGPDGDRFGRQPQDSDDGWSVAGRKRRGGN